MIAVRVWIPLTEGDYGDGAGGHHHHFVGSGGNGFGDSWEGIDGDGTGFGLARGSRVVDNDVD